MKIIQKARTDSLAQKAVTSASFLRHKQSTKQATYLMGGISVSACSKCLWISSGVELKLFGQLGSSGKYGILRHSLGSSRPNAIVCSNKKIIIISVKCILLLSHSKTHSVAKQISHRGKNMVLLSSVPPRRMTFKCCQIHHREE